ncbi:unnamed protein product [Arabis nemorensis]|uniref:DYW domain-containing protein n=1 Tax=Arabis nemorensis TaxID=586526 RepID=A0A565C5X6_9BRAS|nr:unnamed protein product [Arabis nemorensis]
MYTKRALFRRANSALESPSSSESVIRIRKFLSTAVERLDFGDPHGYRVEDSSATSDCAKECEGSQERTESCGQVTQSVVEFQHSNNKSQTLVLNHDRSWQQNLSMSDYQGNRQNPSSGANSGSSWHSGKTFDCNIHDKVEEFDAFCDQDNLRMALSSMKKLEMMGHYLDLARLLRLAQLCGEEQVFQEAHDLQEAKVAVHRKISASIYHLDENHLKYHTDVVIEEFDAFCKQGKVKKALNAIDTLASMSHVVGLTRLVRLAKRCGEAEAVQEAKAVHGRISVSVCHLDVSSYHVLIEMYSNCGLVDEALSVFEKMPEKNLETWCSIIRCLANNGAGEDAIDMFTRFKNEGNKPDGQLFRGIFYACGVLGDVDEGLLHFESMVKDYAIIPSMEHYVSIVEMFALPGFLDEALEFAEKMPMEPNAEVWETLMNLSRVHGDLELGDRCAEIVEELDPTRLKKPSREGFLPVRASDVVKETIKKRPQVHGLYGISGRHEYKAGDTNLPENDELFELLRNLKKHMVEMGYVARTKLALHDVDEESKEAALLSHSERIAFARGVLNSAPRTSFIVIKNLRVCGDCHNALKIMADIVGREVVMRDVKRFHHLKNGACSCRDYW